MSARYEEFLDFAQEAMLFVGFTTRRGRVVDYAVVLLRVTADGVETIRVYDGVHGYNEMHRYTSADGKQDGREFHSGTLAEGMRTAINAIKRGHREMIEGWGKR